MSLLPKRSLHEGEKLYLRAPRDCIACYAWDCAGAGGDLRHWCIYAYW